MGRGGGGWESAYQSPPPSSCLTSHLRVLQAHRLSKGGRERGWGGRRRRAICSRGLLRPLNKHEAAPLCAHTCKGVRGCVCENGGSTYNQNVFGGQANTAVILEGAAGYPLLMKLV